MKRVNWSRNELILAFNLYCKTPFSKINANNASVKELAWIIGRSPSAVALKLANFARLDPSLQMRNIAGMSHGSKNEIEIWNEFHSNWEELVFQSEAILADLKKEPLEKSSEIETNDLPAAGREKESIVKIRVNQSFFRKTILASYDNHCCITGISVPELLVASHITPWSVDILNRMNPHNGICLNALHDKAFDKGLITITTDFRVKISGDLIDNRNIPSKFFLSYDGKKIKLPQRFLPATEFLEYHNKNIFIGN